MGARSGGLRRVSGEVVKFSAVNVVATVVALIIFNLLIHGVTGLYTPGPLHAHPQSAYLIANSIGMIISFDGSRRFAFRHRRPSGPGGGALNFVIINLASFSIPIACLWVTRNVFGWDTLLADNIAANVVGGVLGGLARFWAFRTFVFKRRTPEDQDATNITCFGPMAVKHQGPDVETAPVPGPVGSRPPDAGAQGSLPAPLPGGEELGVADERGGGAEHLVGEQERDVARAVAAHAQFERTEDPS